jgi:L-iditol 2-dehydrogenase
VLSFHADGHAVVLRLQHRSDQLFLRLNVACANASQTPISNNRIRGISLAGRRLLRAIQLIGPENLVQHDLPSRALTRWEIRIRVEATCVCGSDLKNYRRPVVLPQVPGHEFSGRVLETGPFCSGDLHPGDRVTAFPMMSCLRCAECAAGSHRDCPWKQSLGFHIPGSFAEEVIVDERLAVPLIASIAPARDTAIVIIGDGPIALADVQALRVIGYRDLTVVGKHASRLRLAGKLGAQRTTTGWAPGESAVGLCVYAAPADATLEAILRDIVAGGVVFPQARIHSKAALDAMDRSRISLGRAFAYLLSDFRDVMALMANGVLRTDELVTTRLELRDVPGAVASFFEKDKHFKIMIAG